MDRNTYFLVNSILQSSNAGKQEYGRRFAYALGLIPGPRGPDDGVDGSGEWCGKKIHFQSKLRSYQLDVEDAKSYVADILYHKAEATIMLSGIGFKNTFPKRLDAYEELKTVEIVLLQLADVFDNTEIFQQACRVLPPLRRVDRDALR